tara:strand:- start:839 stop:1219 length:381 start_codon:yes stop_codon:yes gene_type:complete
MAKEKKRSVRQLKVGEQLRHVLAELFTNGDLRDPDLAGRSITVCEVQVSADMRNATVYVLPLGGFDEKLVVGALGRASSFLRSEVGRRVRLKYLPKLTFVNDYSFDNASEIDRLLADPGVIRDLAP